MARALWLPTVLRAAGLTVHEVPGWQTRGSDSWTASGIICHATAGSRTATDQAEINVLLTGSQTAPPPIAQLYLSRTGAWYVVASGRCNHALTGWGGPLSGLGNGRLLGIEAANDNRGEPWPAAQYDSYARGVAALCRRLGFGIGKVAGHKEHQPPAAGHSSIKTDPTFPMDAFRARVQQYLSGATPAGSEDEVTRDDLYNLIAGVAIGVTGEGHVNERAPDSLKNAGGPGEGQKQLRQATLIGIVRQVEELGAAVAELKAGPAGTVTLTSEDRAAIVADFAAMLGPIAEAAAERVLERVRLDVPPAG